MCASHYIICRTMTDELVACPFYKLACWHAVKPTVLRMPRERVRLDRVPHLAILDSKPSIRLKNQLCLTLSVKSSCGYYTLCHSEVMTGWL
jgi:hypothetical protein